MSFFKNLFSCTFNSTENERNADFRHKQDVKNQQIETDNDNMKANLLEIKDDVKIIKNDIAFLYRVKAVTDGDMKRIEDKINNNFALMTSKIDSVIMMLNQRNK